MLYSELICLIDSKIELKERYIIAIDGKAGSGKSTLATMLQQKYNATVFCMDDYFLQPHQRTKERSAMIGGNVDFERFLKQVLLPLSKNESVQYQRYNCTTQTIEPILHVRANPIVVIEGSYSLRPELRSYYDLTIALDIDPSIQIQRIKQRNKNYEDFINRWIPLENNYLQYFDIYNQVDIVMNNTK